VDKEGVFKADSVLILVGFGSIRNKMIVVPGDVLLELGLIDVGVHNSGGVIGSHSGRAHRSRLGNCFS
jgi:hypothetical protein